MVSDVNYVPATDMGHIIVDSTVSVPSTYHWFLIESF